MNQEIHNSLWPYVLTFLPDNLELQARNVGALQRARGVKGAEQLLRMILAYGITNQPLSGIVAWAESIGIASMSASAFMYRLEDSTVWLSQLISEVLSDIFREPPGINGYRLRITDATVINGPGQGSVDWRVHVFMDSLTGRLASVELSDQHQGEGYGIHPLRKNDLVLGDRGYGYARSIMKAIHCEADVLVRLNPNNIRLCDQSKKVINWEELKLLVPQTGTVEFNLLLPEPPPKEKSNGWSLEKAQSWIPVRVIGIRNIKGEIFWILTTIPTDKMNSKDILKLYKLRWQIELLFKRLKSLLRLDTLPAKTKPVARAWLLARLLAAALIERLAYEGQHFSPWGYCI